MRTFAKSSKLNNVCYDIRGPVMDEANRMIAQGDKIIKLNIGNPAPFDFNAPDYILREMSEHAGREAALTAARRCRMGILRYSEEKIPHFVSFLRQADGGCRFFNVNDGLEDYVCSVEMFFEDHVGTAQYVSVFTIE